MSLSHSLCFLNLENPLIEFQQKVFVCVVDNIVVGNIVNNRIISGGMEVFMPTWENLEKILTSPNHKFIKNDKCVLNGTVWDGEEFKAPIIEEENLESNNISYDIIHKKVQNSYICYDNNMWIAVKDYTNYIIQLLEDFLNKNPLVCLNIIINIDKDISFDNENRVVKLGINYEQTIVSDEIVAFGIEPQEKIEFNNKKYTVRMEMFNFLNQMDKVIDYSNPNIKNIEISGLYNDYFKKIKYISPAFYKSVATVTPVEKVNNIVTLFSDIIPSTRRQNIITELSNIDKYINKNDCYSNDLAEILLNTKILVNIHQSDYENTFEEIRVLPALMKKVIVISEISPLTDLVLYNSLIVWATCDNIVEKTKEVLNNYDTYFNNIFNNNNIELLNSLDSQNNNIISKVFE